MMFGSAINIDLLSTIFDISVKSAGILLFAALLNFLLNRRSASLRHFVWCLALIAILVLPLLSTQMPGFNVSLYPDFFSKPGPVPENLQIANRPLLNTEAGSRITVQTDENRSPARKINNPPQNPPPKKPILATPSNKNNSQLSIHWTWWITFVWFVGIFVGFLRMTTGFAGVRYILKNAEEIKRKEVLRLSGTISRNIGIRKNIKLLESKMVHVPMTLGILNPVILLPETAATWDTNRLSVVLLHEFSHVKRYDMLFNVVAGIAKTIFWFNPLVWYAHMRLSIERERACDDIVLNTGIRSSDYADLLLEVARSLKTNSQRPFAAAFMAFASQLEKRMGTILDKKTNRQKMSPATAIVTCAVTLALVLPFSAMQPTENKITFQDEIEEKIVEDVIPLTIPLIDDLQDEVNVDSASLETTGLNDGSNQNLMSADQSSKLQINDKSVEVIVSKDTIKERLRYTPSVAPVQVYDDNVIQISDRFGARADPISGAKDIHQGVDIPGEKGTPVHATADGTILELHKSTNGSFGKYVRISHNHSKYGYETKYGHLSKINPDLKVGSNVRRWDNIGEIGSTGRATAPHLHYEVIRWGEFVDPQLHGITEKEIDNQSENNPLNKEFTILKIDDEIVLVKYTNGEIKNISNFQINFHQPLPSRIIPDDYLSKASKDKLIFIPYYPRKDTPEIKNISLKVVDRNEQIRPSGNNASENQDNSTAIIAYTWDEEKTDGDIMFYAYQDEFFSAYGYDEDKKEEWTADVKDIIEIVIGESGEASSDQADAQAPIENTGIIEGYISEKTTNLPLEGVRIILSNRRYDTKTDENGYFKFSNMPSGTYDLTALLDGFNSVLYKNIVVADDKSSTLRFALDNTRGRLEGTIIDEESGLPIGGASIYINGTSYGASTDRFGKFTINDILPSSYKVAVGFPEYVTEIIGPISFKGDSLVELTVQMVKAGVINNNKALVQFFEFQKLLRSDTNSKLVWPQETEYLIELTDGSTVNITGLEMVSGNNTNSDMERVTGKILEVDEGLREWNIYSGKVLQYDDNYIIRIQSGLSENPGIVPEVIFLFSDNNRILLKGRSMDNNDSWEIPIYKVKKIKYYKK